MACPPALKPDTAATGLHHDRSAPGTIELLARSAGHQALAILASDDESTFLDGRQNNHAFGLVEQVGRNAAFAVHQRIERLPGFFHPRLALGISASVATGINRKSTAEAMLVTQVSFNKCSRFMHALIANSFVK